MLSKWGPVFFAASLTATILLGSPATASAQEQPVDVLPGTVASDITMKLERDGRLSVIERITIPDGEPVQRKVLLRQPEGENRDRVFTVDEASVNGNGTLEGNAQELAVTLRPGVSTLQYSVGGAVAESGDLQEVRWQVSGGWEVPVDRVEVSSFIAPKVPQGITCLAGAPGTTTQCDRFEIGHTQSVRALKFGLKPGERMDLAIKLPSATVPSNAVWQESSTLARAFSLSPASGAGLAGVGLLLIGGFGLLWYARGRDVRVVAGDAGPVEVLMTDPDGSVRFASPDGVLPGQVGTVIDEHVDVVDVAATVVDLAVRNYVWIEELPGEQEARDWRIVRVNPPDNSLLSYERAVYEMILGTEHGAEAQQDALLSQLGEGMNLSGVRDALYADVVDKNWFGRRPDAERNLFWWIGAGLAVAGVALTIGLALTTSLALVGIGVVLGGIALTFAARLMPARTRRGSALVAQVRGLREYLRDASADAIPTEDREMVFSRSLPYAVVLGETQRWLEEFAELDPGADGTPGLYWYGELVEQEGHSMPNLRRFRSRFPMFLAALDSAIVRAGRMR